MAEIPRAANEAADEFAVNPLGELAVGAASTGGRRVGAAKRRGALAAAFTAVLLIAVVRPEKLPTSATRLHRGESFRIGSSGREKSLRGSPRRCQHKTAVSSDNAQPAATHCWPNDLSRR
jgi:hypothetical protein